MNRCRKWRVHQHDIRYDTRIEMVVDMGGVKPCGRDGRKDLPENASTALGDLIKSERCAGQFREDCEVAGTGRRLQYDIGRRNGGCNARDIR